MANYVYKITNKINGKYYIGKRSHPNPEKDLYMGSGKQIVAAISKYGKESFNKDILQIFESNEEAAAYEKSLVTKEEIRKGMMYNMHEGGHGGFAHLNTSDTAHRERASKGGKTSWQRHLKDCETGRFKKGDARTKEASAKANAKRMQYGLTEEHKRKLSEARRAKNEIYKNKCWIKNELNERKFINKQDKNKYPDWIFCNKSLNVEEK